MAIEKKLLTQSGKVTELSGHLYGVLIGTDGSNDPTVTFYDDAGPVQGSEIIPTVTYDASALGLNGVTLPTMLEKGVPFTNGLFVEIVIAAGNVEVMVFYSEGI
jgi:hypothetical protein